MIVGKEFLAKLKDFGLNSYEVKLWVSLLSRGISTAGELSDIANVPRSRTYDVLESLEKKGFIIMKIGKPIKYLTIEPERVIDIIKKNIQNDAQVKAQMIENIKETEILNELKMLHSQGIEHVDSSDLSASVKGRSNIYTHLEASIASAESTITIMTTPQGFVEKIEALQPALEKAAKRGVTIRIATQLNKESKKAAEQIKDIAEVRESTISGRFILIDGKELLFMVLDTKDVHPSYDVGIWVNTPFFTKAMEDLFELAWKEMKVKA